MNMKKALFAGIALLAAMHAVAIIVEVVKPYQIRYGALLPKGLDNLLVAGRCVSASSVAAAAIRVMPPCMAMGQAAGTAAALAVKAGVSPRRVAVNELVASLRAAGVWLQ